MLHPALLSRAQRAALVVANSTMFLALAFGVEPAYAQGAAPQPGLLGQLGLNLPVDLTTSPLGVRVNLPLGSSAIKADVVLGQPVAVPPPVPLAVPPPVPLAIPPAPPVPVPHPALPTTHSPVVMPGAPSGEASHAVPEVAAASVRAEPPLGRETVEERPVSAGPVGEAPVVGPDRPAPLPTVAPSPPGGAQEVAIAPVIEGKDVAAQAAFSLTAGVLLLLDALLLWRAVPSLRRRRVV